MKKNHNNKGNQQYKNLNIRFLLKNSHIKNILKIIFVLFFNVFLFVKQVQGGSLKIQMKLPFSENYSPYDTPSRNSYSNSTNNNTSNTGSNTTSENLITILQNNTFNSTFIDTSTQFNCSSQQLFIYWQPQENHQRNTVYQLVLSNLVNQNYGSLQNIKGVYGVVKPSVVKTQCSLDSSNFNLTTICNISIANNCPQDVGIFNYYDEIQIKVYNVSQIISYTLICDRQINTNTFQYSIIIQIIYVSFILAIFSFYSRAWSIKGNGIDFNIYWVIGFNLIFVIGALIGFFETDILNVILQVLSWIACIISVGFLLNQSIFLLKIQFVQKGVTFQITQKIKIQIKIINLISLLFGIGAAFLWWFLNKNWIVSDLITLCIIITVLKIVKFTSLKIALINYVISFSIQLLFLLLIFFILGTTFNNIVINKLNNVFILQLPNFTPIYDHKCSWLSVTSVCFPGMLISYLRRFDTSRSTPYYVYLTVSMIVFVIGSTVWELLSFGNYFDLPFGLVSQPVTILLVVLFSFRRKELRILWQGHFYDQQFAHKQFAVSNLEKALRQKMKSYQKQTSSNIQKKLENNQYLSEKSERSKKSFQSSLVKGLRLQDSSYLSDDSKKNKKNEQSFFSGILSQKNGVQMQEVKISVLEQKRVTQVKPVGSLRSSFRNSKDGQGI